MNEFSSESRIRNPRKLLKEIYDGFRNGYYYGYRLFIKDIRGQNRGLKLGYIWNFGEPIIYAVIFLIIREGSILFESGMDLPLSLYVLIGLMCYQNFVQSLVRAMNVIEENAVLMNQVKIPSESFVLAIILRSGFEFVFPIPIVGALLIYYDIFELFNFVSCYGLLFIAMLGGVGIGLLLSPFVTIYPDLSRLVSLSLRPLMFVAPVFYAIETGGILDKVNAFIPFSVLLVKSRELIVSGFFSIDSLFVTHVIAVFITLIISVVFFNLCLPVINKK